MFVLAAGLVALALRRNSARIRYGVWLAASTKFLIPFSLLIGLGTLAPWPRAETTSAAAVAPAVSIAIDQIAEPFTDVLATPALASDSITRTNWIPLLLAIGWAAGFLTIVVLRLRAWWRVRSWLRSSAPLTLPGVILPAGVELRSSPTLLEPGIVGLRRHVLLVPEGIDTHLTRLQFDAVLAHELCHVRRRDNLTALIHMAVEAVFWFHPLVWWIGARLVDERERACDEDVLRVFGEPKAYAEGILKVCKRYVETPLACVSGVTGSNLKKRIEAIMVNHVGIRLSPARRIVLLSEAVRRGVKPTCGAVNGGPNGGNWRYEHGGQNLAVVANVLSMDLGVKVVDRTGITDKFNILWEYGPDDSTPGTLRWLSTHMPELQARPTAASIFTALRDQLGLQLERIKGQRGFIVIDSIERPTPDGPVFLAPPARATGPGR